MRKVSLVWLVISLIGAFVFLGLLFELGAHDPYRWMTPGVDSLASRDLWNERKWLYVYALAGSFISALISGVLLIYQKYKKKSAPLR